MSKRSRLQLGRCDLGEIDLSMLFYTFSPESERSRLATETGVVVLMTLWNAGLVCSFETIIVASVKKDIKKQIVTGEPEDTYSIRITAFASVVTGQAKRPPYPVEGGCRNAWLSSGLGHPGEYRLLKITTKNQTAESIRPVNSAIIKCVWNKYNNVQ